MRPQTNNLALNQLTAEWIRTANQILKQLDNWLDALVRRDLDAIQGAQWPLEKSLSVLESLSPNTQYPIPNPQVELARQIRQKLELCFSIIENEMDYTHAVISMIVRAKEKEPYCSVSCASPAPLSTLINTEA